MQAGLALRWDTIYYQEGQWDSEYSSYKNASIWRKERESVTAEKLAVFDSEYLIFYTIDQNGALYCLYSQEEADGKLSFSVRKIDAQGDIIYDNMVLHPMQELAGVVVGEVNEAGLLFLADVTGNLYLFDDNGLRCTARAPWYGEDYYNTLQGMVNCGDEGIYFYRASEADLILYQIDERDGAVKETAVISIQEVIEDPNDRTQMNIQKINTSYMKVYSGYNRGILLSDTESLWRYDPELAKTEKLFEWGNASINLQGYMIPAIGILENGSLYIAAYKNSDEIFYVQIEDKPQKEIAKKESITVGIVEYATVASEAILEISSSFNRENEKYQIALQKYPSLLEFQLDLVQGKGPDIIYLNDLDIMPLARQGVLEDLSPYFAKSDVVKSTDLLPSVQRAGLIGDRYVLVFPFFNIHGFWIEKRYVDGHGWTADDYIDWGMKHPDGRMVDDTLAYEESILNQLLYADMTHYIDWEKRECFFDTEPFIELLEQIKNLPVPKESYRLSIEETLAMGITEALEHGWQHFTEGDVLLSQFTTGSILNDSSWIRNEGMTDGAYAEIVGYPNQDKLPCYEMYIIAPLAMNHASNNKDGAWEFFEYFLSEEFQSKHTGFSVREDAFERHLQIREFRGRDIKLSPEDREFIRFLADNSYYLKSTYTNTILQIISEETAYFWSGEKTGEEVARVIQSRVEIYLQE